MVRVVQRSGSVCCTGVRSLTHDWRPQRDGRQKSWARLNFRPPTSFGESCYHIHQWPALTTMKSHWKWMENGAFWLQGQIWSEHSQTSSLILVDNLVDFFFLVNLTATGQRQTENSIVVAQQWQCSHWSKRSTSQACRKTRQQHSDLCSFNLENIIIIILLQISLWHLFPKLFTALFMKGLFGSKHGTILY